MIGDIILIDLPGKVNGRNVIVRLRAYEGNWGTPFLGTDEIEIIEQKNEQMEINKREKGETGT